jgi:hypothetical protein
MLLAWSVAESVQAQTFDNVWLFSVKRLTLSDQILSPLDYTGLAATWNAEHSGFYKRHPRLSWQNRNTFTLGYTINTPATATILLLETNIAYGAYGHFFDRSHRWQVAAGGFAEARLAGKYNGRNVNNPASVDAAVTLHAAAMASYLLRIKKLHVRLSCELSTPFLGGMFVPEYGASYYEFSLGNWNNAFHLSSFHNLYGIDGRVNIDLLFRNFTLRLGWQDYYRRWQANHLTFRQTQHGLGIGAVVNLRLTGGRKADHAVNRESEN